VPLLPRTSRRPSGPKMAPWPDDVVGPLYFWIMKFLILRSK
jgi:hypothetical protein